MVVKTASMRTSLPSPECIHKSNTTYLKDRMAKVPQNCIINPKNCEDRHMYYVGAPVMSSTNQGTYTYMYAYMYAYMYGTTSGRHLLYTHNTVSTGYIVP